MEGLRMVETALAMQPLLNNALKGDNLDKVGYDRRCIGISDLQCRFSPFRSSQSI